MGNSGSTGANLHKQLGCGTLVGWPGLKVVEPHPDKREELEKLADDLMKRHTAAPLAAPVKRSRDESYAKECYKGSAPEVAQWRSWATHCWGSPTVPFCTVIDEEVYNSLPSTPVPQEDVVPLRRGRAASKAVRPDDPGPPKDCVPAAWLGPQLHHLIEKPKVAGDDDLPDDRDDRYGYSKQAGTQAPVYTTKNLRMEVKEPKKPEADKDRSTPSSPVTKPVQPVAGAPPAANVNKPSVDSVKALVDAAALQREFKTRYTLGKRLNAGAQGVTYLATANFSGREVVVKKPNNAADTSDYQLLASKTHPNIVRVYELFQDRVETFIVMEFCAGGDLFHAIESLKQPTQNWTAAVFRQVVWGVRYLHDYFDESHNDIKPENIFLDRRVTSSSDVPRAMIGDFGCLTKIGKAKNGGDPRYRSPEVMHFPCFGRASDVWSLGVTLFEIASGGLLVYLNRPNLSSWDKFCKSGQWTQMMACLQRGTPPSLEALKGSEEETGDLKDLLSGMLCVNVSRRWTLSQVLDCEWMKVARKEEPVKFDEAAYENLQSRAQRHVLDIALLNLLGSMLQGQSLRYYETIWKRYDLDGNGAMGFDEFKKLVEDLGLDGSGSRNRASDAGVPPLSPADLFALADGNRSGMIEFNEFVGLMFSPEQLSCEERASFFKHAFLTLAGEDGKLSSEELAGVFTNNNWTDAKVSSEVISSLFKQLDVDANGFVDYNEFASYVDEL